MYGQGELGVERGHAHPARGGVKGEVVAHDGGQHAAVQAALVQVVGVAGNVVRPGDTDEALRGGVRGEYRRR